MLTVRIEEFPFEEQSNHGPKVFMRKLVASIGNSDESNAPVFSSIDQTAGIVFISDFSRKLIEAFHKRLAIPYTVVLLNP